MSGTPPDVGRTYPSRRSGLNRVMVPDNMRTPPVVRAAIRSLPAEPALEHATPTAPCVGRLSSATSRGFLLTGSERQVRSDDIVGIHEAVGPVRQPYLIELAVGSQDREGIASCQFSYLAGARVGPLEDLGRCVAQLDVSGCRLVCAHQRPCLPCEDLPRSQHHPPGLLRPGERRLLLTRA